MFLRAAFVMLALAAAKELRDLSLLVALNYHEHLFGDVTLFFQMGRGILNGLVPYATLYESKPPGIFLLSALSLFLTGGKELYWILFVVFTMVTPFAVALYVANSTRTCATTTRVLMTLISFLYIGGVSLYAMQRGGIENAEPFGAFFACLYVLSIASVQRPSWLRTTLAGIFLLCTIGIREPFLLSLLAAALLLADNNRSLLRSFVLPLLIALVVGAIVLALLGCLHSYVTVYLPDTFTARIPAIRSYSLPGQQPTISGIPNPLWLRSLSFLLVASDISFGAYPLLALALAVLVLSRPLFVSRQSPRIVIALSLAVLALGLWALNNAYLYVQLLEILHFRFPIANALFRWLTIELAVLLLLSVIGGGILTRLDSARSGIVVRTIAAICLTAAAAGITNEYTRHMVFMVPFFLAAILTFIHWASHNMPHPATAVFVWFMAGLLSVMPFDSLFQEVYQSQIVAADKNTDADEVRTTGEKLDALMDQCAFARFVTLGALQTGTMRHSPYQIQYGEVRAFQDPVNQVLRANFLRDLEQTPLLVSLVPDFLEVNVGAMTPSMKDSAVRSIVAGEFTMVPPACAKPFLPLDQGTSVYFRRSKS